MYQVFIVLEPQALLSQACCCMVIVPPLIDWTGVYRSVNEFEDPTSIWFWSVRPSRELKDEVVNVIRLR